VTKGLHHHGDAPEAAGYTIPELARLARSAFPAQRCVAFQTLGRILYRLGKGEWGAEGSDMATGLWRCVAEGRVLEGLQEAAERERHLSAKSYAIEAVWNWQQGGGQLWKAG
jgi:RNA polymerase II-associated protein 1